MAITISDASSVLYTVHPSTIYIHASLHEPGRTGYVHLTHLNCTMLGWFSFLRFRMSVSFWSLTFFTATTSPFSLPLKTAPWAPEPSHFRSLIVSNSISQSSAHFKNYYLLCIIVTPKQWQHSLLINQYTFHFTSFQHRLSHFKHLHNSPGENGLSLIYSILI